MEQKMPSFADGMYCSHTSAALACSAVFRSTERYFSCPRAPRSLDQCFQNGCHGHRPTLPSMPRSPNGRAAFAAEWGSFKLISQTRLLGIIIDDSLSWSPHVDSICKNVWPKNWCFTSYVQAIDSHGKKAIFRLSDSARFGVCCFSNHLLHADWSTRPTSGAVEKGRSMPGRCSSPRWCLTIDKKFKADSLISSLVPTTSHHHPTLSPTVRSGVTPGET